MLCKHRAIRRRWQSYGNCMHIDRQKTASCLWWKWICGKTLSLWWNVWWSLTHICNQCALYTKCMNNKNITWPLSSTSSPLFQFEWSENSIIGIFRLSSFSYMEKCLHKHPCKDIYQAEYKYYRKSANRTCNGGQEKIKSNRPEENVNWKLNAQRRPRESDFVKNDDFRCRQIILLRPK